MLAYLLNLDEEDAHDPRYPWCPAIRGAGCQPQDAALPLGREKPRLLHEVGRANAVGFISDGVGVTSGFVADSLSWWP